MADRFTGILNYFQVDERLATSGQPTAAQFAEIAAAGYEMVINLALPTSDNALPNEGEIVSGHGLSYVHIPVVWERPTADDLRLFCGVMQAAADKKVWVHCALNWRVSCFVYLYRQHVLGLPQEEASYPMREIWTPTGVWADLVASAEQILK